MENDNNDIYLPMEKIMPLHLFSVRVNNGDFRNRKLQVAVTYSGEILFAATQWLGAAMGCDDAKSSGNKVQDIIVKLPCLRHAGGSLNELTSIDVSNQ
jgi:hypothetical protein